MQQQQHQQQQQQPKLKEIHPLMNLTDLDYAYMMRCDTWIKNKRNKCKTDIIKDTKDWRYSPWALILTELLEYRLVCKCSNEGKFASNRSDIRNMWYSYSQITDLLETRVKFLVSTEYKLGNIAGDLLKLVNNKRFLCSRMMTGDYSIFKWSNLLTFLKHRKIPNSAEWEYDKVEFFYELNPLLFKNSNVSAVEDYILESLHERKHVGTFLEFIDSMHLLAGVTPNQHPVPVLPIDRRLMYSDETHKSELLTHNMYSWKSTTENVLPPSMQWMREFAADDPDEIMRGYTGAVFKYMEAFANFRRCMDIEKTVYRPYDEKDVIDGEETRCKTARRAIEAFERARVFLTIADSVEDFAKVAAYFGNQHALFEDKFKDFRKSIAVSSYYYQAQLLVMIGDRSLKPITKPSESFYFYAAAMGMKLFTALGSDWLLFTSGRPELMIYCNIIVNELIRIYHICDRYFRLILRNVEPLVHGLAVKMQHLVAERDKFLSRTDTLYNRAGMPRMVVRDFFEKELKHTLIDYGSVENIVGKRKYIIEYHHQVTLPKTSIWDELEAGTNTNINIVIT